jgi:cytoskeleton protein RodZ
MRERSHIAGLLKGAREQRGLSVERAAGESGIPLRYLQLLEGENPAIGIPDEFYLIPFFRRYATYVGLEVEPLLPEFLGQVQQVRGDAPPPALIYLQSPVSLLSLARLWKPAAALLAIAVAVFLLTRSTPDDEVVAAEASLVRHEPGPATAPVAAPESATVPAVPIAMPIAAAERAASDESAPTVAAAEPGGQRELRIVATELVWLSLGLDDDPEREFMLQPGDSRTWLATVGFKLKLGNAGGVTVALDGRELPPLGASGQVVRVRLPETAPLPSGG